MGLSGVLESLWGVEFSPLSGLVVGFSRPLGFVVAERRVGLRGGGCGVYWVRKVGVSSLRVARELEGVTGGRVWYFGLKDSDAVAYQWFLVEGGVLPGVVGGVGWRGWLIGYRGCGGLGGHLWNNFRVDLLVDGDNVEACRVIAGSRVVPGFYGPQRFGVVRPNSHVVGLYRGLGWLGHGLWEYSYSYPMGGAPGGYEERSVGRARALGDPFAGLGGPGRLMVEAFQSYVWNRALSIAWEEGYEGYAERVSRALCPGERRAWLARLPSRRLLGSGSRWAGLVGYILEEEGVPRRVLPARAPMRPLAVEACRLSCRPLGDGVRVWMTLPRGLYATMAVRSWFWVDWVGEVYQSAGPGTGGGGV